MVAVYSVPVTGGAPVRLTPPLDPNSGLFSFTFTPDGRRVIYSIERPDPNSVMGSDSSPRIGMWTVAVYSVPIEGGSPVQLVASGDAADSIGPRVLTDDGQYLLYQPRSANTL